MSDLTIYIGNKNYSSWSLRAWLALEHCAVPFREVMVDLSIPAPRPGPGGVLPAGRVPVLQHGDLPVWDSLAIAEYLAETFPHAKLWPASPTARAKARSVSAEMHSGFQAMRNEMSMNIRRRVTGKARSAECDQDIARVAAIWNDCRASADAKGGPFLFGEFTNADAFYAPVATRFRTYGVELDAICAAYADAIFALPAMRAWCSAGEAEAGIPRYEV